MLSLVEQCEIILSATREDPQALQGCVMAAGVIMVPWQECSHLLHGFHGWQAVCDELPSIYSSVAGGSCNIRHTNEVDLALRANENLFVWQEVTIFRFQMIFRWISYIILQTFSEITYISWNMGMISYHLWMNWSETSTDIPHGWFTDTWAIIWPPQC